MGKKCMDRPSTGSSEALAPQYGVKICGGLDVLRVVSGLKNLARMEKKNLLPLRKVGTGVYDFLCTFFLEATTKTAKGFAGNLDLPLTCHFPCFHFVMGGTL